MLRLCVLTDYSVILLFDASFVIVSDLQAQLTQMRQELGEKHNSPVEITLRLDDITRRLDETSERLDP